MTTEKKAPDPEKNKEPLTNQTKEYQSPSPRSIHLTRFSESIKNKWVVKRDENGDEFIRLNGKNALLNGGLDHIYMIDEDIVGLWLTTRQINSRLKKLKKSVPDIRIEQSGGVESILSCGIEYLEELCKAVGARRRRTVSDENAEHLRQINPRLKHQKPSTNGESQGCFESENKGAV